MEADVLDDHLGGVVFLTQSGDRRTHLGDVVRRCRTVRGEDRGLALEADTNRLKIAVLELSDRDEEVHGEHEPIGVERLLHVCARALAPRKHADGLEEPHAVAKRVPTDAELLGQLPLVG